MKFDIQSLRYMSRDDFRVLVAVEMGMRNHELVPLELVAAIANIRGGGAHKIIGELLRNILIVHEKRMYDGFRLTTAGYDFLALRSLLQRGAIAEVGRKIGVGKESDIFIVRDADETELALKLHRLGRRSFRNIIKKRDYLKHRRSAGWLYLSKLAAVKEYAFMKALHDAGFPTPTPIDCNRHAVVMSLVPGTVLASVREVPDPRALFHTCVSQVARLAQCGLIHCDLNEHNIMVHANGVDITIIDFPQMVSMDHLNAREMFERDVTCLRLFFRRRFGLEDAEYPTWAAVQQRRSEEQESGAGRLDVAVEASGFTPAMQRELEAAMAEDEAAAAAEGGDEDEDDDEEEEEDGEEGEAAAAPPADPSTAAPADSATAAAPEAAASGPPVAPAAALDSAPAAAAVVVDEEEEAEMLRRADAAEAAACLDGAAGGEEEEEEEEEESDEEEERGPSSAALEALARERPPDGARTRAGGRRVRLQAGGEAYLRDKPRRHVGAEGDDGGAGEPLTAAERESAAAAIRACVRAGMERQASKAAVRSAAAAGKSAAGPRGRNKDGPHGGRKGARDAAKAGADAWG